LLDLPVLGMIPYLVPEQNAATGGMALLRHETPRTWLAESYKTTRTNLEFLRRSRRAQVLLISSAHAGDGKSTRASYLAITLANAGRRVLLVDGDLRKPLLHRIYNVSRDRGLSDALVRGESIRALALPTVVENLDILTSGHDVANPAELLASPRLGEALEEVRTIYDTIIIDSSPLLAVTDPSIIAAVADGLILIVRVAST
jgi:capsular exopolysaccharide synthesis family protein